MSIFIADTPTIFRQKFIELQANCLVLKNIPGEWKETLSDISEEKVESVFFESIRQATKVYNPSHQMGVKVPVKVEAQKNGTPIIYGQWMIVQIPM